MDYKEKLLAVRNDIDAIDTEMLQLFSQRMKLIDKVANIKIEGNISLVDEKREDAIIAARTKDLQGEEKGESSLFIRSMMGISKTRQRKYLYGEKAVNDSYLPAPSAPVKTDITVGYQGVAGAWSEIASIKVFPDAEQIAFEEWEDVFTAVKNKTINYGVLPVENSQTGAIGEVYDLLRKHGCYIVGQTWVPVQHCLMGTQDATLDSVREIFSHPQGFAQCNQFLRKKGWELTVCRNTAVATEKVKTLNDPKYAAIGAKRAGELNSLKVLDDDIISDTNNKTRFIVIANQPEYDETADTVSVIFRTAHRSGALVDVLFPFVCENINLSRLESRPMADGKYCFFADIQGSIADRKIVETLKQVDSGCGFLEVLGCYNSDML